MRAISRIGIHQAGRQFVWRGVKNRRFPIASSLARDLSIRDVVLAEGALRAAELAIVREARNWGVGLDLPGPATDLQLLAHLQHHGSPTRLLDVTSNPMTALWFSCEHADDNGRDAAGVLFAFDITDVPKLSTVDTAGGQMYGSLSDPLGWSLRRALAESAHDSLPFVVRPTYPDARMTAQEGLFLAGAMPHQLVDDGVDDLPIRLGKPPTQKSLAGLFTATERRQGRPLALPFCALIVPANIKNRIRPHLEGTYNRSYKTLFPDPDGFAEALRTNRVNLAPRPM